MTSSKDSVTYKEAQDLQREMERTLQKLERAGLLREAAGDEIRIIVAEGIAEHFGERYRVFPIGVKHEGLNIRRDSVPKTCVLMRHIKKPVAVTCQTSQAQVSYVVTPSKSGCLHDNTCNSSPEGIVVPKTTEPAQNQDAGIPTTLSHCLPSEKDVQRKRGEGLANVDKARREALNTVDWSRNFVSIGQCLIQAAATKCEHPTRKASAPKGAVVVRCPPSAAQEEELNFRTKGIIDVYETQEPAKSWDDAKQLICTTSPRRHAPNKVESYAGDLIDLST